MSEEYPLDCGTEEEAVLRRAEEIAGSLLSAIKRRDLGQHLPERARELTRAIERWTDIRRGDV